MQPTNIPSQLHSLEEFLQAGSYLGYAYSYPHKTAYREFGSARRLQDVWAGEPSDSLFLYAHIPFCEMRCGFCNLFTFSQPDADLPTAYLATLRRQAQAIRGHLQNAQFNRVAIGGGTPTYLSTRQLEELFAVLQLFGADLEAAPLGIEASPATVDPEKLALLKSFGVDRLSMGVQSWDEQDVGSMGRPQQTGEVERALDWIHDAGFETLNLDLIYGAEGQSESSWLTTIGRTLDFAPQEIYLYPLYVRPLTGLSGRAATERRDDPRLHLYRAGRQKLLDAGYEQVSMRMFQLPRKRGRESTTYRCQEDGMIGLGCGARSYTRSLHYADQFAVKQTAVMRIIEQYCQQTDVEFLEARCGIELRTEDRQRRYLILSLLLCEGLELASFEREFGVDAFHAIPCLNELLDGELALLGATHLQLTPRGLEQSDVIGPWLYSNNVRERMEGFTWIDA